MRRAARQAATVPSPQAAHARGGGQHSAFVLGRSLLLKYETAALSSPRACGSEARARLIGKGSQLRPRDERRPEFVVNVHVYLAQTGGESAQLYTSKTSLRIKCSTRTQAEHRALPLVAKALRQVDSENVESASRGSLHREVRTPLIKCKRAEGAQTGQKPGIRGSQSSIKSNMLES